MIYIENMKKILVLLILAACILPSFAQESKGISDRITISKIKVFLDNTELSENPEEEEMGKIKRSTILSFTNLKSEKIVSLDYLEKEIKETELRLKDSGLFYNVSVEIIPPRKFPEKRSIIINVTTGFHTRFGGGNAYGVIGKVGLGGGRNQLLGYLGWNRNGVSFIDENSFGLPLILGGRVYADFPAGLFSESKTVSFDEQLTIGWLLTADLRFCLDTKIRVNTRNGFVNEEYLYSPYLYFHHFFKSNLSGNIEVRTYHKPFAAPDFFSGEICGTVNYAPLQKLILAVMVSGGLQIGNNSENKNVLAHNLEINHNSVSDNSLGKRALRSGYESRELVLKNYVATSLEVRWQAMDLVFGKIVPCRILPFIFTDFAYGESFENPDRAWKFFDAYGGGIQILFDNPVFAYFNFAYGLNHEGRGKFCFYTGITF